jgi:pimeloyl-ACP methyl ester carboxylesterase
LVDQEIPNSAEERFHVDHSAFQLRGGRKLAYCVAGPDDGLPLFLFHGLAESRLTAHPDEAILQRLGIELITVDRPGIGMSDAHRGRTLLHWASDVSELADHLRIGQFAILGHSAGAPYALACAYELPHRILSATVVSGIPQPSIRLLKTVRRSDFWKAGTTLYFLPFLIRPAALIGIRRIRKRPLSLVVKCMASLPDGDRQAMRDFPILEMRALSMLEAVRQGPAGFCTEAGLLRRQWGFDLSSIQMPIGIWHGEEDKVVDISFCRELIRTLNRSRPVFKCASGHNLLFSHWEEILDDIKRHSASEFQVTSGNEGDDGPV